MNPAIVKGPCLIVSANNKYLQEKILKLLEEGKQTDSDLKIDVKDENWLYFQKKSDKSTTSYVFDTHDNTGSPSSSSSPSSTIIEKNTMNKFQIDKPATLTTSPPRSRPSSPPPEKQEESPLFRRHKSQVFVVSRELENIMIGDFIAHNDSHYHQVAKLKKELVDLSKNKQTTLPPSSAMIVPIQKSNVDNIMSSQKPMGIRIPSRLCTPNTTTTKSEKVVRHAIQREPNVKFSSKFSKDGPSKNDKSSSHKNQRPRSVTLIPTRIKKESEGVPEKIAKSEQSNISDATNNENGTLQQKYNRKKLFSLPLYNMKKTESGKENPNSVSPSGNGITTIRLRDVVYIDDFTTPYYTGSMYDEGTNSLPEDNTIHNTSLISSTSSASLSNSERGGHKESALTESETSTYSASTSTSLALTMSVTPRRISKRRRTNGRNYTKPSDFPYYNFLPKYNNHLCSKTKYFLSFSRENWKTILRRVSEMSLSLYDAMHYGLLATEDIVPQKTDYMTKNVVINITIPVMQFNYTYKVIFDMYSMVVPLENTDYLFYAQLQELSNNTEKDTKTGPKNTEIESGDDDSSSTSDGDSDHLADISKKGKEKLELSRPKKPLCYVVLLDLTSEMDSSKTLSNLFEHILTWIGMDTVPKDLHGDIFTENLDSNVEEPSTHSSNNRIKEKNFKRFIKKNLFLKNRTFIVIIGHSPQSLVLKQIEAQIKLKKGSTPRSTPVPSLELDEINLENSPRRTTPIRVIPKGISTSSTLPQEQVTYGDETDKILKTVEENTAKVLKIAKKIFGYDFRFMNIDCENKLQVNLLFQKIATLAMTQNVFDSSSDASIHAIPSTSSFVNKMEEIARTNVAPEHISGTKYNMDGWQVSQQHYLSAIADLFKQ